MHKLVDQAVISITGRLEKQAGKGGNGINLFTWQKNALQACRFCLENAIFGSLSRCLL
jgi:hypothetical protein